MNIYTILFNDGFDCQIIDSYEDFKDAYARVKKEYLERGLEVYEEEAVNLSTIITTFFEDSYGEGELYYQTWTIKRNKLQLFS
jgi:hypothetical protein